MLSWSSVSGLSYQVQYKDDLNSPAWLPLGGVIAGTGNPVTVTNQPSASVQRFFRLQVAP
jgi:hypothetical protein